jgi:hypothetical protein
MTYRPYTSVTSTGISDLRINASGVQINKGTPVRINATGDVDFVNVSIEAQALAVAGVAAANIPNLSSGSIVTNGKISDITTSASFGDFMYIDKTGSLTNIKPTIGVNGFVAGDFVVSMGVIAKNLTNALNKDLVISIDVVGQL